MDKTKCKECGEEIKEFCGNCMNNKIEGLVNQIDSLQNEIENLKKKS
ncbi:hypothetical protein HYS31_06330 [Candidatus Woesearchaeota archaeon]|nr:hypothetical protein [Candidatus Woesearchaeota archaeon]